MTWGTGWQGPIKKIMREYIWERYDKPSNSRDVVNLCFIQTIYIYGFRLICQPSVHILYMNNTIVVGWYWHLVKYNNLINRHRNAGNIEDECSHRLFVYVHAVCSELLLSKNMYQLHTSPQLINKLLFEKKNLNKWTYQHECADSIMSLFRRINICIFKG